MAEPCLESFAQCTCALARGHEGPHGCYHCEESERVGLAPEFRHEPGSDTLLATLKELEETKAKLEALRTTSEAVLAYLDRPIDYVDRRAEAVAVALRAALRVAGGGG